MKASFFGTRPNKRGNEPLSVQIKPAAGASSANELLDVSHIEIPETGGFPEEELPKIPNLPPFPSFMNESQSSSDTSIDENQIQEVL